ncbi:nucleoside deaminase [Brachybacterium hainanense]|uniref:Nucleoside deaminase n=1 Tax=Brachybacterium hainanense TaxID=1541174 RepID=A0ABV6R8D5_9MICO
MTAPSPLPRSFGVDLPAWLREEVAAMPPRVPDPVERMRFVVHLSARSVEEGTGGPFAAMVVDRRTDRVVSVATNVVPSSGLSIAHAETVALSLAQTRLGTWDLGADGADHVLITSAQPCAMCLGALIWSGARAVDIAALGSDVEAITGFDEGPVPADWREQLERRGIAVETGRCEAEALAALRGFRTRLDEGGTVLYNGRR